MGTQQAGPGPTFDAAAFTAALAVPVQNSAANVDVADVAGNKTDTVAGSSLVALARQILALAPVSGVDAAANVDFADVIGNKTDTVAGTSIVALARQILALAPVSGVDAAENVDFADVIGNKTDTAGGTSLVALARQILALAPVPAQNAAANVDFADVIGNKTDDEAGTSIMSQLYILTQHIHSQCRVAPSLAAGVTVAATNAGTNWTPGAFSADIIAAGAVAVPFDIHFINVEALSANTTYELILYYGALDTECGRVRFERLNNNEAQNAVPFMSPLLPAGSRVRAKLATPNDNGETVTISAFYHTY